MTRRGDGLPAPLLAELADEARANAAAATNPRTQRAYDSHLRQLHRWAAAVGVQLTLPLPPALLVAYVAHMSGRRLTPKTVGCALWAIGRWHLQACVPSPTGDPRVVEAHHGYLQRWLAAGRRQRRVAALTVAQVRGMMLLPHVRCEARELRDRAIILLAIALAARRSELVALQHHDVQVHRSGGLLVYMARSKTDQAGEGAWLGVPRGEAPLCAAAAVQAWLAAAQPTGPLFCRVHRLGRVQRQHPLRGATVAAVLQDFARRLADPELPWRTVNGHTPRATLVTRLLGQGLDSVAIAQHTRHRSLEMLRRYDRGTVALGKRSVLHALYDEDDDG